VGRTPGRTPWSARVPLDPLYAKRKNSLLPKGPTRASGADQGVRPPAQVTAHFPRRSRKMTHFCSLGLTHLRNRLAQGQAAPPAISSTPQACGG